MTGDAVPVMSIAPPPEAPVTEPPWIVTPAIIGKYPELAACMV